MSYTQLTQGERYHIQYLSRHCTVTEIAKQLNRHKSTISREIRRHRTQGQQYSAEKAQRQSQTIKQRKRQPYLVAMPDMEDAFFSQSVVYICKHDEDGALGIAINK
ncbi:hypothetical protein NM2000063_0388, partial [Neisseria meningitidis 2000063]|uniref:YqgE/AlgH family protein n=1 Tax=Neisseria meningitidis TaxID=487 RepID=UPI0003307AB1